ncbi:parvalbumin-like EF-hand-containing protein [Lampetra fluviatilis]
MASQTFIDREKQLLEMVSALGAKMSDSDLRSVSSSTDGKHAATSLNYRKLLECLSRIGEKEEDIRKVFLQLDKDNSGYIEWNELRYVTAVITGELNKKLSDQETDQILQAIDSNQDGRIDFDEFSALVKEGAAMKK